MEEIFCLKLLNKRFCSTSKKYLILIEVEIYWVKLSKFFFSNLIVTTFTTPKHQNEDEDGDGDAVLRHVAVQVDDVTPF